MANDGGPAFPGYTMNDDGETVSIAKLNPGMFLRAAIAMNVLSGIHAGGNTADIDWPQQGWHDLAAKCAVRAADALIAELANGAN